MEISGFRMLKSIYEARNMPPVGRLFVSYEDPVLFRLGRREGLCGDFDVYKCVLKTFKLYVKAAELNFERNCHSYAGQARDCVSYGKLRYDGHIMYYIEGGEVVIAKFVMAFGLRPESSKYFKYAQLVEPPFFSHVFYSRRHTIVVRPSVSTLIYYVVSTNPEQAQTAVEELHQHVSKLVELEMSYSVQHGGVKLFRSLRES